MLYHRKNDDQLAKTIKSLQDIANGELDDGHDNDNTSFPSSRSPPEAAVTFLSVQDVHPLLILVVACFIAGAVSRAFGPAGRIRSSYSASLLDPNGGAH